MLIYNVLTELRFPQLLLIVIVQLVVVGVMVFSFKRKLLSQQILVSGIGACILSLLSLLCTRATYGGMVYHEQSGWPLQFYHVGRNIELTAHGPEPFDFRFNIPRFIMTTVYWWGIVIVAFFGWTIREKKSNQTVGPIFAGLLLIAATFAFSLHNKSLEQRSVLVEDAVELTVPDRNMAPKDIVLQKKQAIVSAYPEFADFEHDTRSITSQSVKTIPDGDDHYFAYIVHGSGIPLIEANCFRVDRMMHVYKVGVYPDPRDSYNLYIDVDPKTCRGIK